MTDMKQARWGKQVEKLTYKSVITEAEAVKLLARQHAAVVRAVKKLPRFTFDTTQGMVLNEKHGAWIFLDDILAALAKQGGKK